MFCENLEFCSVYVPVEPEPEGPEASLIIGFSVRLLTQTGENTRINLHLND